MKRLDGNYNSLAFIYYFLALALGFSFFMLETGSFPILCFHDVTLGKTKDKLSIQMQSLQQLIKKLGDEGYQFLTATDIKNYFYGYHLPSGKKIFLTFDDAFISHLNFVKPFLEQLLIPAAFCITESNIGKINYLDLKKLNLLLSSPKFWGFFHSKGHFDMSEIEESKWIKESKPTDELQKIFNQSIRAFAFPFGERKAPLIEYIQKNWDIALTVDPSFLTPLHSAWEIPRFMVTDDNVRELTQMFRFYNPGEDWERAMKMLVLLLTFFCGRFAFIAREILEKKLQANL
ncbi:polysaccharide deacetylase family protein [Candidatus Riflebacteria bacterium]